jgi:putative IMPACT (imprinted ancient) family translation regulator
VLIVVVRYFGGKLLGMNRLSNAYRSAAAEMIENATLREAAIENMYALEFPYPQMNEVMKIVKDENLPVINPKYSETCSFETRIRKSRAETIIERLSATVEGFRYTSKKID